VSSVDGFLRWPSVVFPQVREREPYIEGNGSVFGTRGEGISVECVAQKSPPEVMGDPTPHPSEPDSPSGLRMVLEEPIRRRPLIGIDLEVFCFRVDSDVLAIIFLFNLGTNYALEDLLPAFGEFGCFFGHGIGTG